MWLDSIIHIEVAKHDTMLSVFKGYFCIFGCYVTPM